MKKIIIAAASFIISMSSVSAQNWNWDKAHSQLNFGITHLSISEIDGNFGGVTATLVSSKDDLSDAVIELTADINTINTGNEQRNAHLKSPDFFDAAKFGTLVFKSNSFKKTGDKTYKLSGELTMHGITKPIVLDVILNGTTTNPMSKKTVSGFKITGSLKRSDFGLGGQFPTAMLSDEVKLFANAEFLKD